MKPHPKWMWTTIYRWRAKRMNSSNDSLAMQRITRLVDENSFIEIGSLVTARSTDFNLAATDTPSDGVITGHGLIDGNLVFIYSQDASVLNGTIGEMHAKKIAAVYDMAMKMGASFGEPYAHRILIERL